MKTWLMAGLLAFAFSLYAFQDLPRCTSIEPDTAKAGATVSVKGENLNKNSIAEVYLTDGKNDTKVMVSEQTDAEIKIQVPQLTPGRYHLATLTANRQRMIDQPVVLTVE
jgi:hypothetical protein